MAKGFFDAAEGVRSMSRLSIGWLLSLATIVVGVLAFYVVYSLTHAMKPDYQVIGGFAVVLGALVWHGVVALKNKNMPSDAEK